MSTHAASTPRSFWHAVWTVLAWAAAGGAVLGVVLWLSPTAREVASQTALSVLQTLTTPFFFEATLAILGLCIVVVINQWRIHKEGDGWVYLASPDSPSHDAADASLQLHSVVMTDPPERLDDPETGWSVIEGYLALGMVEEAMSELDTLDAGLRQTLTGQGLRLRSLVMLGRESEAEAVWAGLQTEGASAVRQAPDCGSLVQALAQVAQWLHDERSIPQGAEHWWRRAIGLDSDAALQVVPPGHPLSKITA